MQHPASLIRRSHFNAAVTSDACEAAATIPFVDVATRDGEEILTLVLHLLVFPIRFSARLSGKSCS